MQIIDERLNATRQVVEKHLNAYLLPAGDSIIFLGYNDRLDNQIEIICHGELKGVLSVMISALMGLCDTHGLDVTHHLNNALQQRKKEAH